MNLFLINQTKMHNNIKINYKVQLIIMIKKVFLNKTK